MSAEPLLPVGRDCDCGHPLVWRQGAKWCSVWGSHPLDNDRVVYPWNQSAPGAELVRLSMNTPAFTPEHRLAYGRAYDKRYRQRARRHEPARTK